MDKLVKFLIVEDVPLDGELMEKELERDGINFTSIRVEEEEDYIKQLLDFKPNVILADHSLPHFDGISALHIAQEICPQIPFIFVSGQIGEEYAVEMLKKGATDYVLKHNLSKLGHAVKRALNEADEYLKKKEAEEKLAESEKKYRALFNLSPDYVVVLDPNAIVLDINSRVVEETGLSRDEFIGKNIKEIIEHFVSIPDVDEELIHSILTGEDVQPLEIKVNHRGVLSYVEVHSAPMVMEGEIFAIQIIGRNITKRKIAQESLIKSTERLNELTVYLEAIINASPFAIIDLHQDGRVKSLWNPAAESIFGWKREEVIGKSLPFLADNTSLKCQKVINKVFLGDSKSDIELECSRKDGRSINTMMATAPIGGMDGNVLGIMATFADISDMIDAKKQINASLEEKEVLLREIHHRVKNNLQIISSLMSLQSGYTKEPETIMMFKESKHRIRSMALIHEKLYQSHDMAHIDFEGYLKSLVDMILTFYREKSNNVKVSLNSEEANLEIDTAISMGLIVNELLTNCFKHAFPDEKCGEININLTKNNGNYYLKVADNGVGFPDSVDLENTESLGIQIVRTLTSQINGTLEYESKGGTEFTLSFPDKI